MSPSAGPRRPPPARGRPLAGVGVDELHVDAARPAGHEQELLAGGRGVLDDDLCERGEQVALDRALERPGPELRREAAVDEQRERRLVVLDRPRPSAQAAPVLDLAELLLEQRAHLLAGEGPEDDDAVEAVEELGPERLRDDPLDPLGAEGLIGAPVEADRRPARDGRADVRREDEDAAAEVDLRALEVGEAAVVEDLEEDVPDRARGLLELVEQDDGERVGANRRDERRRLLLAARVRQQPLEAVGRLELAHVEPDEPRSPTRTCTRRGSWRSRSCRCRSGRRTGRRRAGGSGR